MIRYRPESVRKRKDLMIHRRGHGPTNITTAVQRIKRYAVLFRNIVRRSKPIKSSLTELFATCPDMSAAWNSCHGANWKRDWARKPGNAIRTGPWQEPTVANTALVAV